MIKDTHNGKDLKDDKARASENSKTFDAGAYPEDNKAEVKNMADGAPSENGALGRDADDMVASLKEELQKKNQELDSVKDVMLRRQADFENYKKMQMESQKEFVKYAAENLVLQIIPVLDNFHLSTDHIPEDQKNNAWVTGIMHIQKQLENVLKENGVTEIETKKGDQFNPEVHEAVSDSNDSNEHPNDSNELKVKKVLMKGYRINGKIIRAVKVIVE